MPDPPGYQERLRREEEEDRAKRIRQAAEYSERRRLGRMAVQEALRVLETKPMVLIRPG